MQPAIGAYWMSYSTVARHQLPFVSAHWMIYVPVILDAGMIRRYVTEMNHDCEISYRCDSLGGINGRTGR